MDEGKRYEVLQMTLTGNLTVAKAAEVLGISPRQVWRLKNRVKAKGMAGVAHGNRGRPGRKKLSGNTVRRIVALRRDKYEGFNDTHFTEKLAEEGMNVGREVVRRVLRQAGIGSPQKRRRAVYRSRREPKAQEGLMLQGDGSRHDWLEGRGPWLCLVGLIDDATKRVTGAVFREQETMEGYFTALARTFRVFGLCHSIYADRHTIFHTERKLTLEEELAGEKQPRTQLGRAMDELGITLIAAHSPQAKGRVERLWGTFQDRLVSELRLAKATTLREAQQVLERCLPEHNRRFMRQAANLEPAWRPLPKKLDLNRILCLKYRRIVARDNTIKFGGKHFQIPAIKPFYSLANKKVDVLVLTNNMVEIYYKGIKLLAATRKNLALEAA